MTKRKRILICAAEYPPVGSGIANVAFNLRQEFARRHNVTICSPVGPDLRLGSWPLISKTGGIGVAWFWYCVGKYLQKNASKYDAILLENPLLFHNIPTSNIFITTHTTYSAYYENVKAHCGFAYRCLYLLMRRIERYTYRRLPKGIRYTSASDYVTTEMVKLGVPKNKIKYISNGAHVARFKPVAASAKKALRKRYHIDPSLLTFLFIGRIRHEHQPLELLEMFAQVQKKVPAQLVIVGDGDLREQANEFVRARGIKNVHFLKRVPYERIHELYQLADFFFMNSLYVGQSLVTLEAMAAGLPLVVPDIREFRRAVGESGTGCLFTPRNPNKGAVNIIDYVLRADKSAQQQRAREYAKATFDWAAIAKQYEDYFFTSSD